MRFEHNYETNFSLFNMNEPPQMCEGISTCVPSLLEDFMSGDILIMLESLENQTVASKEVIIVLSNSKQQAGGAECKGKVEIH